MPKKVDHDLRRRELAKATFGLISKSGLSGLTLTKVAKEVGFSIGAIAHYAHTRDDLLLLAGDYAVDVGTALAEQTLKKYKGVEALRRLLYDTLPTTQLRSNAWLIWLDFCERANAKKDPRMRAILLERHKGYTKWFVDRIESAKKAGEVSPDIDAARMAQNALALVEGIGVMILVRGHSFSAKAQRGMIDDWIAGMLRPMPGS